MSPSLVAWARSKCVSKQISRQRPNCPGSKERAPGSIYPRLSTRTQHQKGTPPICRPRIFPKCEYGLNGILVSTKEIAARARFPLRPKADITVAAARSENSSCCWAPLSWRQWNCSWASLAWARLPWPQQRGGPRSRWGQWTAFGALRPRSSRPDC